MAHSFVMYDKDKALKGKFGPHWSMLMKKDVKVLRAVPDNLSIHLSMIATLKSFEKMDDLKSYSYSKEKDLHVSTLCLKLVSDAVRSGLFQRQKLLENDILINVWCIVDRVLNSYGLIARRGEPCSLSSAARRNKDRTAATVTRKKIGRRNDLIIYSHSGLELGCGEAGLEEGDFDTKVIVESGLKTPKIMHDMFVRLCKSLSNNDKEVRKIAIVGLVFSRFKLSLLVMDCPDGYLCRIRSTNTVQFTGREESLGSEFSKVYQLLWQAKEICADTERIIETYTNNMEVGYASDNDDDKIDPPQSLPSP